MTLDSESSNPSSSLGRTFFFLFPSHFLYSPKTLSPKPPNFPHKNGRLIFSHSHTHSSMIVTYFTPSNLNLSPTSPHSLPLLKMDSQISDKIKLTVTDILNSSDIDSITEKQVRHLVSQKLNLDLSDLPYKILVRQIIESFLLSIPDNYQNDDVLPTSMNVAQKETVVKEEQENNPVVHSCRVICKVGFF